MASELLVPEPCTGSEGSSGVDYRRVANAGDLPRHVGMEQKEGKYRKYLLLYYDHNIVQLYYSK